MQVRTVRLCGFGFLRRRKRGLTQGLQRRRAEDAEKKRSKAGVSPLRPTFAIEVAEGGGFPLADGNLQFWLANCGYET